MRASDAPPTPFRGDGRDALAMSEPAYLNSLDRVRADAGDLGFLEPTVEHMAGELVKDLATTVVMGCRVTQAAHESPVRLSGAPPEHDAVSICPL